MALREIDARELSRLFDERIRFCGKPHDQYEEELRAYARASSKRIFDTLTLIRKHYLKHNGRVLEIGPFPFFTTLALLELSDDRVTGIGAPETAWPGEPYSVSGRTVEIKTGNKAYPFTWWCANVEKDDFPFEGGSFDLVICAEVIEHLIQDPGRMLFECNRVLRDDGILLLSTPNGLFWEYIFKLIFYGSGEPYAKYGVYARHNRLWALSEVCDILGGNNFRVVESICNYGRAVNTRPAGRVCAPAACMQNAAHFLFRQTVKIPLPFLKKKDGDQLYVVAKKCAQPRRYAPEYLYAANFGYNPEKYGKI